MCMKKFDAVNLFSNNLQGLNLAIFRQLHILNDA